MIPARPFRVHSKATEFAGAPLVPPSKAKPSRRRGEPARAKAPPAGASPQSGEKSRAGVKARSAPKARGGAHARSGAPSRSATPAQGLRLRGSRHELTAAALRWMVDPASLGFRTTVELEPLRGVHAQARALEALRVGINLRAPGYNVFCVGLAGSTRMETVRDALAQLDPRCVPAPDRCYVMNFRQHESPRLLELPRGLARRFQRDVDDLVDQLVKHLGLVFEEDRFAGRVRGITEKHQHQERDLLNRLHDLARESGFTVSQVETDGNNTVDLLYRLQGHLVPIHELERAVQDASAGIVPELAETTEENEALVPILAGLDVPRLTAAHESLSEMLRKAMVESRRIARTMHRQLQALEREESLVVVEAAVQELTSRYPGIPSVRTHLDDLRNDVLDHLQLFKRGAKQADSEGEAEEEAAGPPAGDIWLRYRVNVVADNSGRDECPILVESNPSVRNLFGTVVPKFDAAGRPQVDHRSIRPGSLLGADGGYLLLDAADVIAEADSAACRMGSASRSKRETMRPGCSARRAACSARSATAPASSGGIRSASPIRRANSPTFRTFATVRSMSQSNSARILKTCLKSTSIVSRKS